MYRKFFHPAVGVIASNSPTSHRLKPQPPCIQGLLLLSTSPFLWSFHHSPTIQSLEVMLCFLNTPSSSRGRASACVMSSGWTSGLSHLAHQLLCFFNTSSASPTSGVPCAPGCQCSHRAYTEGCCISHHLMIPVVLPAPAFSTTLGARQAYESCPLTALCPPPSVVLAPCRGSTGIGEIKFTGENAEAQSGQMGRMPLAWEAVQLVPLSCHYPSLPLCLLWHLRTIYSPLTTSLFLGLHLSFLCQTLPSFLMFSPPAAQQPWTSRAIGKPRPGRTRLTDHRRHFDSWKNP